MRVRFDRFVLDTERKVLARGGATVHLTPRAFRLLALLVAERPRAVSKRELLDTIWSGSIVEESSLKSLVLEIRTALEGRGGSPGVIRTVYGHGYAFDAETVEESAESPPEARVRVGVQARTIFLPEGSHEIGRLPTCAVFIDTPSVSRIHARLHVGRNTLLIEDAGSKNGTFVCGERITGGVPLGARSLVRCGDVDITIEKMTGTALETQTIDPLDTTG